MKSLEAQTLSPTVDNTGLDGEYDFPEIFAGPSLERISRIASVSDHTRDAQNLFSAVQEQLNLKLETTKAESIF